MTHTHTRTHMQQPAVTGALLAMALKDFSMSRFYLTGRCRYLISQASRLPSSEAISNNRDTPHPERLWEIHNLQTQQ